MVFIIISALAYSQKIETVDGVRVVHNEKGGKWGNKPEISIKLLRTLGDIDTEDENLAFNTPSDIMMDEAGNVYILDSSNQRIQKFSPDGKYLATIGRKGQGPGEFNYRSSIDIDANGNLYVLESTRKIIHVLSPEGKELKTVRVLKDNVMKIRRLNSGLLAAGVYLGFGRSASEQKDKARPKLMKTFDLEGNAKMEFADAFDYGDDFSTSAGNLFLFDADSEDNLYLSFYNQNRVEKYSPKGICLWKADRPLNYSSEMQAKGKIERSERGVAMESPKFNVCSNGISVDGKRRAWVITLNRQLKKEEQISVISTSASARTIGDRELQKTDAYKLEIFDTDGVLLGEIPLDHFVSVIRIVKDNLFLIDVERRAKVFQYKIIEK
jgi:WD40 repeat protein